jgi:hypothetical protein
VPTAWKAATNVPMEPLAMTVLKLTTLSTPSAT